jgi:hypothetical protein
MSSFNINDNPQGVGAIPWLIQGLKTLWRRVNGISGSGGGGTSNATELQGVPIDTTAPATNQYLKYDGTKWKPGKISTGDPLDSASQGLLAVSVTGQIANPTGNIGDVLRINNSGDPAFLSPIGVIPIIQAVADLTNQTASVATVVSYTQPNTQHATFKVGGYINLITISVNTLVLTVGWTDESNNVRSQDFFPMGATTATLSSSGFTAFPEVTIRAKKNSTITISTTAAGVGSQNYDVGASIVQIN